MVSCYSSSEFYSYWDWKRRRGNRYLIWASRPLHSFLSNMERQVQYLAGGLLALDRTCLSIHHSQRHQPQLQDTMPSHWLKNKKVGFGKK